VALWPRYVLKPGIEGVLWYLVNFKAVNERGRANFIDMPLQNLDRELGR
jgi:hypothetical protein